MRRRLFVAGLCSVLAPAAGLAQQRTKIPRVGLLLVRERPASLETDANLGAFLRAMRDLGYIEGRNVHYEWRFTGDMSRGPLDAAVLELVGAKVDVLVTPGTVSTLAAQRARTSIPIVFTAVADPVGSGVVQSLARPGGNTTGVSMFQGELGAKQLEFLRRVVPKRTRIGLISNPANAGNLPTVVQIKQAGQKAGLHIVHLEARNPEEIERAFTTLSQERAQAVVVNPDAFFIERTGQFAGLAAKFRLPAMYGVREFVEAGGLMSYGVSLSENWRRAASYVDKIIKGAKPQELPVEQPTKFELFINLKTAGDLGITFPVEMVALADKVIR